MPPLAFRRVSEAMAKVGELELCYETFGDPERPALLLVMGLGTQMVALARRSSASSSPARGFYVIRFDNRDVGRSTHLHEAPPPTARQLLARDRRAARLHARGHGRRRRRPARRARHRRAHVVGASMGGMIAQTHGRPAPGPGALARLDHVQHRAPLEAAAGRCASTRCSCAARRATARARSSASSTVFRLIGSPGFPFDEAELRAIAERSCDRGHDPAGPARQLAAIIASGDRTAELRRITAPDAS